MRVYRAKLYCATTPTQVEHVWIKAADSYPETVVSLAKLIIESSLVMFPKADDDSEIVIPSSQIVYIDIDPEIWNVDFEESGWKREKKLQA